ncbi:MAG: hypothetical protein HOP12_07830 [Candidatus Eisenbacteria bacterium]|uniref:Dockerin domain-containing protein n=1 Tax=Eiseniibacteriota bacterium TaxID=2212470 RepID=A0A849SN80_UNCEI|nr:hypothetical protein [Candidatus Eisenbacteria bacterium]
MTGSVRKATLLAVCGLLTASAAFAGVPSAGTSSLNGLFIRLGSTNNSAVVEPQVDKNIVVRDALGGVVQNSTVEIRFGTCTSTGEFRLCGTQPHAGVGVSCVDKAVVAVTDASGVANFRVVGHALNVGGGTSGAPAAGLGNVQCAEVRADGVVLGSLRVKAFDQNGAAGVNAVDVSLVLNDRFSVVGGPFSASYRSRSDFNDDGFVNPVDLSTELNVRFSNASLNSCAALSVCAP